MTGYKRPGVGRLEMGDWRWEIGDGRLEMGDWGREIGVDSLFRGNDRGRFMHIRNVMIRRSEAIVMVHQQNFLNSAIDKNVEQSTGVYLLGPPGHALTIFLK